MGSGARGRGDVVGAVRSADSTVNTSVIDAMPFQLDLPERY